MIRKRFCWKLFLNSIPKEQEWFLLKISKNGYFINVKCLDSNLKILGNLLTLQIFKVTPLLCRNKYEFILTDCIIQKFRWWWNQLQRPNSIDCENFIETRSYASEGEKLINMFFWSSNPSFCLVITFLWFFIKDLCHSFWHFCHFLNNSLKYELLSILPRTHTCNRNLKIQSLCKFCIRPSEYDWLVCR